MNVRDELLSIVCEYVDLPAEEINIKENIKFATGLDSFVMFSLIGSIEDHFLISIPNEELLRFKTLEDIIRYVEANILT